MTNNITKFLPDRSNSDVPPQVQLFLSICESAVGWHDWQKKYGETPRGYFCEGVVDYWWDGDLEEPTWEMVTRGNDLTDDDNYIPPHRYFCYQQGAIVGYRLRERYR